MEKEKSSVDQVYESYFEIIDDYFGSIKHHLGKQKDSHIDLGYSISNYPLISDLILDAINDLYNVLEDFWIENAKPVIDHLKASNALKCVYSGKISPSILEDFIKKSSLYVDSIIIPDPILNLSIMQNQTRVEKKYFLNYLIRHVFNVWKIKDLVTAGSDKKILYILPLNLQLVNSESKKQLFASADNRTISYLNSITHKDFSDVAEILLFLEKFHTVDNLHREIKVPELLPVIFKDASLFNEIMSDFSSALNKTQFEDKSIGWQFGFYVKSQFLRVQEHKYFCEILNAEPIYDYELPWFFFNYEMGSRGIDDAIINSLQRDKFDWITNVPLSAVKVFREEGKLEYMRGVLRRSLTDLKAKNDSDLLGVSKQVEKNFHEAFKKQNAEIKSLEQKVKNITKMEIPIVTGGFLAGFIPFIGNVVSIASVFRDVKNLFKSRERTLNKLSDEENNFISLLMKSYEK